MSALLYWTKKNEQTNKKQKHTTMKQKANTHKKKTKQETVYKISTRRLQPHFCVDIR